jgi:hypothetical protein
MYVVATSRDQAADQAAIKALILRYGEQLNSNNVAEIMTCFTGDAYETLLNFYKE